MNQLQNIFPQMFLHEGVWEGVYRTIDEKGKTIDVHKSRVECIFPASGPIVYIQKNKFEWENGTIKKSEFGGIIKHDKIYWDTDTFYGYGWGSEQNTVLLHLVRKDIPNASFTEVIVINEKGDHRVRTWHWFRHGTCYQRTLCTENKL